MKRRDVLKRAAALGVAGSFAGCVGRQETPDSGGGGGNGGDDETTTERPVSVANRRIDESRGTCGQENDASIAFEEESVRITGSIPVSDPCHRAEMSQSSFDATSGELDVEMGVVEADSDACQQCLGRVDYEAVVEFTGGLPRSVSVAHPGEEGPETVATAENTG